MIPHKPSKLEARLLSTLTRAVHDYGLLADGDRVLVGLSGGKDSYGLIWLLREFQRRAPFRFELLAVNLDQGHPGFPQHVIRDWCDVNGFDSRMLHRDTYTVVKEKVPAGKTACSLCSRLRRGILYDASVDLGCTKIALGHHRDDVIETLLLNLMFSGRMQAMPAKLRSDDGRNTVIRPLVTCDEADLAALAVERAFPVVPCDLCGSQENLQRAQVKRMLAEWEAKNPRTKESIFAAMANIRPTHLYDTSLWERLGIDHLGADDGVP